MIKFKRTGDSNHLKSIPYKTKMGDDLVVVWYRDQKVFHIFDANKGKRIKSGTIQGATDVSIKIAMKWLLQELGVQF